MAWSAPVPHPDPLGTRLQFSPNICQHQNKSGHGTLAGEPLRVDELLRLAVPAINIYGAMIGRIVRVKLDGTQYGVVCAGSPPGPARDALTVQPKYLPAPEQIRPRDPRRICSGAGRY